MRCLALSAAVAAVSSLPASLRAQTVGVDTFVIGDWSVLIGGTSWRVAIEPDRRYRIWHWGDRGDTLVASMGTWRVHAAGHGAAATFCIAPIGRDPICGPLAITERAEGRGAMWRFADSTAGAFSWLGYRRGYAPWDSASVELYGMTEVVVKPRLIGCSRPLRAPVDAEGPIHVVVRFVVETDGTPSAIHVVEPGLAAVRDAAVAIVRSCRFAPGELSGGRHVRVLVALPMELRLLPSLGTVGFPRPSWGRRPHTPRHHDAQARC